MDARRRADHGATQAWQKTRLRWAIPRSPRDHSPFCPRIQSVHRRCSRRWIFDSRKRAPSGEKWRRARAQSSRGWRKVTAEELGRWRELAKEDWPSGRGREPSAVGCSPWEGHLGERTSLFRSLSRWETVIFWLHRARIGFDGFRLEWPRGTWGLRFMSPPSNSAEGHAAAMWANPPRIVRNRKALVFFCYEVEGGGDGPDKEVPRAVSSARRDSSGRRRHTSPTSQWSHALHLVDWAVRGE
jgi:hypothetical protein